MSYQNSPFGGANNVEKDKADGSASPTNAHYGIRDTEAGVVSGGKLHGAAGLYTEAVVYVKPEDFTFSGGAGLFNTQLSLPAGAIPVEAYFEVSEAFAQTGGETATTLTVGTSDGLSPPTEATITSNGFATTDASVGIPVVTEVDSSGAGTWAAALAAETPVGVALTSGGGAITACSTGEVKIVIRYIKQ